MSVDATGVLPMIVSVGCYSPSSDLLHPLHWLPVRHRI